MKRNFVIGLFGGLIGAGMLLILLSATGVVGAHDADVARSDVSRVESVASATLTSTFTYQGQLKNGGNAVTSLCDFQFGLWNSLSGGTQIGITQTVSGISVTASYFTALLNTGNQFGDTAFNGDARWLQTAVRCPTGGSYTPLSPRQQLTSLPFALPGLRTFPNATSPNIVGGFSGNSIINAVGSTIGGGGFDGEANTINNSFAFIGGGFGNQVNGPDATVGGGTYNQANGLEATVGGGSNNQANADYAMDGGGEYNQATGSHATVGGGEINQATGSRATVGGGFGNHANGIQATVGGGDINQANGINATVGGGYNNIAGGYASTVGGGLSNQANGGAATIGGGQNNQANGGSATIGGGYGNQAIAVYATVGGGNVNQANGIQATVGGGDHNQASGINATVGGGYDNIASGYISTIPGGISNRASMTYTFAAGYKAQALHQGAFVWSDSTGTDFASTANDQFFVRASGGIYFFASPNAFGGGNCYLPANGSGWTCSSDRNLKEHFSAIDSQGVLQKLAAMPISQWNMKGASIPHIGPMAQDFYAAFGLGEDDTHINSTDAQGVAFAAIQGLYQENQDLKARIAQLEQTATASNPPAQAEPFNVSTLLSVIAFAGFGFMWLQQRRSKRGGRS